MEELTPHTNMPGLATARPLSQVWHKQTLPSRSPTVATKRAGFPDTYGGGRHCPSVPPQQERQIAAESQADRQPCPPAYPQKLQQDFLTSHMGKKKPCLPVGLQQPQLSHNRKAYTAHTGDTPGAPGSSGLRRWQHLPQKATTFKTRRWS